MIHSRPFAVVYKTTQIALLLEGVLGGFDNEMDSSTLEQRTDLEGWLLDTSGDSRAFILHTLLTRCASGGCRVW